MIIPCNIFQLSNEEGFFLRRQWGKITGFGVCKNVKMKINRDEPLSESKSRVGALGGFHGLCLKAQFHLSLRP